MGIDLSSGDGIERLFRQLNFDGESVFFGAFDTIGDVPNVLLKL